MSNLNIRERDSPTHLHQFDANYGKIQYMSDPLDKHTPIKRQIKTMGYQRNEKVYVSQRQNLQTNDKGK